MPRKNKVTTGKYSRLYETEADDRGFPADGWIRARDNRSSYQGSRRDIEESPISLHTAVTRGDVAAVKRLLETGVADVNAHDGNGETPLTIAVSLRHTDIIQLLIAADGVDVNACNSLREAPVLIAASLGYADIVSLLIASGGAAGVANAADGWTPLRIAIHRGHADVVEALITEGRVHVSSRHIFAAIERFPAKKGSCSNARRAYADIVKALVAADAAARNGAGGETPLHIAVSRGYVGIVEALIESGAYVDSRCFAIAIRRVPTNQQTYAAIITLLMGGWSPAVAETSAILAIFIYACQLNLPQYTEVVKELITEDHDVNGPGSDGAETPICIAAFLGCAEVVTALIAGGADVNACGTVDDSYGVSRGTPLWFAARNCDADVMKLLLDAGADVDGLADVEADDDEDPRPVRKFRFNSSPLFEALRAATRSRHIRAIDMLLDEGASTEGVRNHYYMPEYSTKAVAALKRRGIL